MTVLDNSVSRAFSKNSISNKLLAYILLSSSILTLIITVSHLIWDYYQDVNVIKDNMNQIEIAFVPPITKSLWDLNSEQIEAQVSSLIKLSNIEYISITYIVDGNQTTFTEKGVFKTDLDISQSFDLIINKKIIGTLFVGVSLDRIYQRLIDKSVIIFVSQGIKTLIVSICILLIIYYLVIRHLNHIVHYTQHLDLHNSSNRLLLKGREYKTRHFDELDILVTTYNSMQDEINAELVAKEKYNDELIKERDFSKKIIQCSTSVICCLDNNFIISSMNPAGETLIGSNHKNKQHSRWTDIFVEESKKEEITKRLTANKNIENLEVAMINPQHKKCALLWTFTPMYQGDKNKTYLAFGYDITHLKAIEKEIKQLNHQLESKVESRTKSLQESNQQLEEAFKNIMQTQNSLIEAEKMASLGGLVAGVAHEINTPLGISVMASSYLKDEVNHLSLRMTEKTISEKFINKLIINMGKSVELLESNLKRSVDLVSDFKQVAVDQSNEEYSEFNIDQYLNQVISSLQHEIKKHQCIVNIICQPNLKIKSIPGRFAQIFTNLILNSLIHGFSDWHGNKEINITIKTNQESLYIDYKDSGRGITESIKERIFEPFVTTKRGRGGSGLGTHIIYNIIVQLLKGSITCNSSVTEGAHFLIAVPLLKD
jgi:signal transduction histidine kinase